jgi:MazG family protein
MNLQRLHDIVARLRDPVSGCPWDQRQDFKSIANYTLEEVYEVIDAINRQDYDELKDELGDLLLQVVFHALIAEEYGYFTLQEVQDSICEKMIRRHPHVFGVSQERTHDETHIKKTWEAEKARERANKNRHGALDGVPLALPALKRAQKLQKRASSAGFDWEQVAGVLDKIREEIAELEQAIDNTDDEEIVDELGDLFFSCVNLSRYLKIDAESALNAANSKFEDRFRAMENSVKSQNRTIQDCSLSELEQIWQKIKQTVDK